MGVASKIAAGAKAKVSEDGTVLDVSEGTWFYDDVEEYNRILHDHIQLLGQGLYLLFATRAPYSIYLPLVQKNG